MSEEIIRLETLAMRKFCEQFEWADVLACLRTEQYEELIRLYQKSSLQFDASVKEAV